MFGQMGVGQLGTGARSALGGANFTGRGPRFGGRTGFGGTWARNIGKGARSAEEFLGRTANIPKLGNMSYGRAGLAGGLGMLAMSQGKNMYDRVRYGDYGGAMLSGALAGAAGYGAYSVAMGRGALRSHFKNAAAMIMRNLR